MSKLDYLLDSYLTPYLTINRPAKPHIKALLIAMILRKLLIFSSLSYVKCPVVDVARPFSCCSIQQ